MENRTSDPILTFRLAEETEIERIWEIILQAKAQMRRLNSKQWDDNYPAIETIQQDIRDRNGYVLLADNRIIAYGVVSFDGEPAYKEIDGKWSNELPYMIVHRLAVAEEAKRQGIAKRFMLEAENVSRQKGIYNFRVDTNFDNAYMLHLIDTLGFKYSGLVYYRGTNERRAFEKSIRPHSHALDLPEYTIREACFEDGEAIFHAIYKNREDLRVWLPFVDSLKSVSDEQLFLKSVLEVPYERRDIVFVLEKGTELCGLIGIHFTDWNNHRTEIGYWLLPAYRGQGIVTAAVRYLCKWAVNVRGMNRIQIRCAVENQPSNAIPQRLGFTHEGTEREGELLVSGTYADIHIYSILKKEIEKWNKKSN